MGPDVQIIRDKEGLLALSEQWDALSAGRGSLSPALSHDWFACWVDAFGEPVELLVVAAYEGGSLAGVAPLCLSESTHRGIPCRQVRFLYNRHGPRCTFLVREGRAEYCRVLLEAILEFGDWDLAVLENIPEESCLSELEREGKLARALGGRFWSLRRRTMSSPLLRIRGSWEEFYSSRPRSLRRSLRSKEKRLFAAGEVSIEHHTDSGSALAAMDTLFRVGERSWKAAKGRAIGSDAGSRAFYTRLAETFGAHGQVSVWLMHLGGEPAAFEFHITRDATVQALRAEFDEKYRGLGVGSILDREIVKRLFELGFREYDMGGEADFYKLRWTAEVREHSELLLFRKSARGRLLHAVETGAVEPLKRLLGRGAAQPKTQKEE